MLGPALGMPAAVSAHNNYFLWGPPSDDINAVVVMTTNPTRSAEDLEHVQKVGETDCGDCMPYEKPASDLHRVGTPTAVGHDLAGAQAF